MLTDIEIAQRAEIRKIGEIAGKIGIGEDKLECYGRYKAKVDYSRIEGRRGRLVLVTAINPTPAGEG